VFTQHIKSKMLQKWLMHLNQNKANLYVENEKLKETLQNQRWIIAKMDKELQSKNLTIEYLTQQLTTTMKPASITTSQNLLEFMD
jgi:regulator of replication initiation timing